MPSAPIRYRYLDGLRGLSIVPVLLGHTYDAALVPAWFRMLFAADAGVRVFFVVSGFIITQLLLRERAAHGRVRLGAFYGRRGAKLLPVLWAYVLVIVVTQQFVDLHCSLVQLAAAALLASGFLREGTWYVGHFWSLTVEEVFYLSWAPVMAVATRRSAAWVASGILLGAGLCRAFNVAASSHHFAQAFAFWPQVKVIDDLDGVAIGCLAALAGEALIGPLRARSAWAARALWIAAWATICLGSLQLEQWMTSPVLAWSISLIRRPLMEAAVAVVILVAAETHRSGKTSWLERRPLIALGRASYSIYVVQQALCMPEVWRPETFVHRPPLNIVAAALLGGATFLLIEDPARRALVRRFRLAR